METVVRLPVYTVQKFTTHSRMRTMYIYIYIFIWLMMQDKDNRHDYAETIITKSQNTTLLFVAEVFMMPFLSNHAVGKNNAVGKNEIKRHKRKKTRTNKISRKCIRIRTI